MKLDSFDPVTRQGLAISNLFGLELVISGLLLLLVGGMLVAALVLFRDRGTGEPSPTEGHRWLEIVWTATPTILLASVFVLVLQTMRAVDAAEPGAQRLRVVGHQWWWEFQYPDLGVVTANELHVPVGAPLQVELESVDVIHSFWVPQFGWMRDAVPGKINQMSVLVERPGEYLGACTQFCGAQHAWMRQRIVAEPAEQFATWAQQQRQPAVPSGEHPGQRVFLENTCVSCHAIAGVSSAAQVGPDLTHFGSRATLGAGVLPNTPEELTRWVKDPQQVKPGVLMPSYRSLSDRELADLVAFLESLK